jgi:hypothetical protein
MNTRATRVALLLICGVVVAAALVIFSNKAIAEVAHHTEINCAEISSKIISECTETKIPICRKQIWLVKDQSIDLKASQPEDFHAYKWACLPTYSGEKVIFWFANGGNCEGCERFTIWSPAGEKISDWQNFETKYKEMNFPSVTGQEFLQQFHEVRIK